MTDGEKIAKAAESYIGTPHVNGAKVKGAGIDCGMLLIASLEDAGIIKKIRSRSRRIPMNGTCTIVMNGFCLMSGSIVKRQPLKTQNQAIFSCISTAGVFLMQAFI